MSSSLFLGRVVAVVSIGGSLIALGTACGANVDDIFGNPTGSGGSSSTTSGKTATNSGPGVTSTGTPSSTGPGSPASSGVGSTTAPSSVEASVSSSAAGGTTVPCQGSDCQISQGGCCYNNPSGGGAFGICSADGNCFPNATQILCGVPSDCPGEICCAQRNQENAPYDETSCLAECHYPSLYVCDVANGDGDCPMYTLGNGTVVQSHCEGSQFLPSGQYSVCKVTTM